MKLNLQNPVVVHPVVLEQWSHMVVQGSIQLPRWCCRGTSLTRKRTALGPYSMPMDRVIGGS